MEGLLRGRIYKRTLVKWILSLAAFISVTVAVISMSLFVWYSSDNMKQYSQMVLNKLKNASDAMELYNESLVSTGFFTVHDDQIIALMTSSTDIPNLHTILNNKLQNLIFSSKITNTVYLVDSAYLVNKRASVVIGSPNPNYVDINGICSFVSSSIANRDQNAIIRLNAHKASDMGKSFGSGDVLTYVFFRTRGSSGEDPFLVLNVNEEKLADLLFGGSLTAESTVFALDGAGKIVLSKDPALLYKDYSGTQYFKSIRGTNQDSGFFTSSEGGAETLVTFAHEESLGYTFVSLTPYATVRQASIALRNRTIWLSALILAVGLCIAAVLALYFYSPLGRLLRKYYPQMSAEASGARDASGNEYEMLDQFIEKRSNSATTLARFIDENLPIVKQDFLKNIVEGKIPLDNGESRRRLTETGISLEQDTLRIIYIHIDTAEANAGFEGDLAALRYRVGRIAERILTLVCTCELICDWKDDAVISLLNYDRKAPGNAEGILAACRTIQEQAQENANATLIIAVGKETVNDVHASYADALELLTYRVKYGAGALITPERVAADIAGHDLFPEKEEKNLLKGMRALSKEACSSAIRQIVKGFYEYSIGDILRAVNHILYSTYQVAGELLKNKDPSGEFDYFIAYEQLTKYNTLTELEDNLILLCDGIINEIGASANTEVDGNSRMIRTVTDIVRENYNNPMLSLEFVASRVKLNPYYLGKIFKEHTNLYFTEYVNNLRIERAKELLLSTNENVNWISASVGYNSSAYFATTFKKSMGMTPARFREMGKA